MVPLPPALLDVTGGQRVGAFTLREALAAGYTERGIRTLLGHDRWERLRRGIFADRRMKAADSCGLLAAEAASLAYADASISHGTAASWWKLAHLWRITTAAHVTCPPTRNVTGRSAGSLVLHVADLPEHQRRSRHGISVTSVERTVLDVTRAHGILDGLVVADSALHNGLTSRERLEQVCGTMRHWPNVKRAREILPILDARAHNTLESLCRFRWLQAGLQVPELQAWIYDQDGFVGVVDGMFTDPFVAYETDGMTKYDLLLDGRDTLHREKLRQERLEATLLVLRRFTWPELWYRPSWCVRRVELAREEASRRPPPRARIYVTSRDSPPPSPPEVLAASDPTSFGLTLLYDGTR